MSYQIVVRIGQDDYDHLSELVDSGEFGNISEAVRYCIRMQLKSFKPRSPPPLVKARDGAPPAGRRRRILPSVV